MRSSPWACDLGFKSFFLFVCFLWCDERLTWNGGKLMMSMVGLMTTLPETNSKRP